MRELGRRGGKARAQEGGKTEEREARERDREEGGRGRERGGKERAEEGEGKHKREKEGEDEREKRPHTGHVAQEHVLHNVVSAQPPPASSTPQWCARGALPPFPWFSFAAREPATEKCES